MPGAGGRPTPRRRGWWYEQKPPYASHRGCRAPTCTGSTGAAAARNRSMIDSDVRAMRSLTTPHDWTVLHYDGGILVLNGNGGSLFYRVDEAWRYVASAFVSRGHRLQPQGAA